jgi:hypothetical protein
MYFHEDDLGDAKWRRSFTFQVPEDAKSGAYAARLEAGELSLELADCVPVRVVALIDRLADSSQNAFLHCSV